MVTIGGKAYMCDFFVHTGDTVTMRLVNVSPADVAGIFFDREAVQSFDYDGTTLRGFHTVDIEVERPTVVRVVLKKGAL